MTASELAARLQARPAGDGKWRARCPAHDDKDPSLSVFEDADGRPGLKCFAGCTTDAVLAALGLTREDVWRNRTVRQSNRATPPRNPKRGAGSDRCTSEQQQSNTPQRCNGLTLADLAAAKKLPEEFLAGLGLVNDRNRVKIPYFGADGQPAATRYRVSMDTEPRFFWRRGSRVMLYGLERLAEAHKAGWLLLVEGESDCWTLWHHGLPALGIPGKDVWQPGWEKHLAGIPEVLAWQEPGADSFTERILRDMPHLRVIVAPDGLKDPSAAHLAGQDVPALLADLRRTARPAADLVRERQDAHLRELEAAAAPVLDAADPLTEVRAAMQAAGYAGDLRAPLLVYVAATGRVLHVPPGDLLAHLLLVGGPSCGKSWCVYQTRRLLPPEAVLVIDAGSPRALIYSSEPLAHRALVFSEADSLPAGEDNPAASAIRNLLQDNELAYDVTEKDPATGGYTTRRIRKPGPTVMITTSTRSLGSQLMTRVFAIDAPDDPEHLRQALAAQAQRETSMESTPEPPPALLAMQEVLQARAPWRVTVPFAPALAAKLSEGNPAPRLLRDFKKLLALVKAVTVLRHRRRTQDAAGRWLATLEDYATVRDLAGEVYASAAGSVPETVRKTVEAVAARLALGATEVSVTELAEELGVHKSAASRRANRAVRAGFLVNLETEQGRPARLTTGARLPDDESALPAPEALAEALQRCTPLQPPATAEQHLEPAPPLAFPASVAPLQRLTVGSSNTSSRVVVRL